MADTAMKFVANKDAKSEFVTSAATVSVLEDNKVKICYLDRFDHDGKMTKEINFSDGQKCKIFSFADLPMAFSAEDVGAEVVLRVKSEGGTIVEFLPENENGLKGKFVEFYRMGGEGTNPVPDEKKKFKEGDADVLQFCALFKVEGGSFEGKTVAYFLQFSQSGLAKKSGKPYSFSTFVKDEDGNVALGFQPLPNGTTGYKWSDQIYSLRHCGLLEGKPIQMPEDGNPLLLIEQKLQMANKTVEIEVAKGYMVGLASAKKVGLFQPKVVEPVQEVVVPSLVDPDVM